jgi:hypothetical protein
LGLELSEELIQGSFVEQIGHEQSLYDESLHDACPDDTLRRRY